MNRFFDHIENTFDRNGDLVLGPLGTERPHQLKSQFIYQLPTATTLSVNQFIGSGIPFSEEALVAAGVPFFPYGRGSDSRTDVLTSTDLAIWQDIPWAATFACSWARRS